MGLRIVQCLSKVVHRVVRLHPPILTGNFHCTHFTHPTSLIAHLPLQISVHQPISSVPQANPIGPLTIPTPPPHPVTSNGVTHNPQQHDNSPITHTNICRSPQPQLNRSQKATERRGRVSLGEGGRRGESIGLTTDVVKTKSMIDANIPVPSPWVHTQNDETLDTQKVETIRAAVKRQVNFYFSDDNYHRDKFILNVQEPETGWVEISLIASFNRMRPLTDNVPFIAYAIGDHSNNVELSDCKMKVRRRGKRIFNQSYESPQDI
eukprot:GHVN01083345.1.p2 GENE.GHVN01083345.1~~GHVN01083345.1.p2  ORF type:complete len:264 (-),score=52.68 GHVN01083345.1:1753-2544(-)